MPLLRKKREIKNLQVLWTLKHHHTSRIDHSWVHKVSPKPSCQTITLTLSQTWYTSSPNDCFDMETTIVQSCKPFSFFKSYNGRLCKNGFRVLELLKHPFGCRRVAPIPPNTTVLKYMPASAANVDQVLPRPFKSLDS